MEQKNDFEERIGEDLRRYLLAQGLIDERMPECPDVEDKWREVGEAYLPDGIREFGAWPTVSLGWMMFVGMALAKLWDTDWESYGSRTDLYVFLRDARGYDRWTTTLWKMFWLSTRTVARRRVRSLPSVPDVPIACCATKTLSRARRRLSVPMWLACISSISWVWPWS